MNAGISPGTAQNYAPLILVVEDMGLQVRLIRLCLEKENYRVIVAADGEEALALVQQDRPDLILLDVDLPRLNGFQVLDCLRSQPDTASIPVVMLTAHAKDAPLFDEWKLPADAFMVKPFSPVQLLSAVKNILNQDCVPETADDTPFCLEVHLGTKEPLGASGLVC